MSYVVDREIYHRMDDLPVVFCVIVTGDGVCGVGYSATAPHRFDEKLANAIAKSNAERNLNTTMERRAIKR